MTIGGLLAVILAFLKFPAELTAFIKLLQKTPAEKQADILKQVNAMVAMSQSSDDGRPKWDS